MGILYALTVAVLIVEFILIRKTEKELNILSFIAITITVFFCYNAFICYIMTFVSIPITLLNLSLVNITFCVIMLIYVMQSKKLQKYKMNKLDLLFVIIILIAVLIVSYLNFGFPFNIKYETGDPSVHYLTSVMFAENDSLLNTVQDEVYGGFQGRKIASYVNSGIIMKCCSSIMDEIDYYNIFIAFGIFVLFLTGYMMYMTLEKFAKNNLSKVLALIVSLIYIGGYPLNSLLFGFEYLSLGILILGTIIHMIYYFENEELKMVYILLIFALLNFGVFCSYYLFVPFTYVALWIYFCAYSKKKNGKIIEKNNILILSITLLLPFVLGFIYHLTPGIYNIFNMEAKEALSSSINHSRNILENNFSLYGYIYINFYSNSILFIPLVLYYVIKKRKSIASFDIIFLLFLFLFIIMLLLGKICGKVSTYFIMKNYYALWLILIYLNFKALMSIFAKNKVKVCLCILIYVALIVLNLIFVDTPMKNWPTNDNESLISVVEIFGANKTIIAEHDTDYTRRRIRNIEICKGKFRLRYKYC